MSRARMKTLIACAFAAALCLGGPTAAYASGLPSASVGGAATITADDRAKVAVSTNQAQDQKASAKDEGTSSNADNSEGKKRPSTLMLMAFFGMDLVIVVTLAVYLSRKNKAQTARKHRKIKEKSKAKSKKGKQK